MFFNSILRFIEETYLITTLCSFINLRRVLDQKVAIDLNYVISCVALLIIIGYPLFICALFKLKHETLIGDKFKQRAGVLI